MKPIKNVDTVAKIYKEFAEEDRQLAEVGIDEYADILTKEDQL